MVKNPGEKPVQASGLVSRVDQTRPIPWEVVD
jgi:hypothetical protein